jgi:hypothetical protein
VGADLATAAASAAFIAPLLLIVVYTLTAPWWRLPFGRSLVTVKAAISLAMLPPFVHRLISPGAPATAGFTIFQAATWGVLALVLLWMTWVIISTQHRGSKTEGGGE